MSRSIYEPRLHPRQKQRSTWSFAAGNGRSEPKPPVVLSLFLSRSLSPSRGTKRIRDSDNTLHFRRRTQRRTDTRAHARACQSIIRIGLLKFLRADGQRMEIRPTLKPLVHRLVSIHPRWRVDAPLRFSFEGGERECLGCHPMGRHRRREEWVRRLILWLTV